MSTPVVVRVGGMNHAGDVAVGDEAHSSTGAADRIDDLRVTRTIEHERGDCGRMHILGAGKAADVLRRRRIEIDHMLGIAGADRDLFHVDVWRVQQRAAFGHCHGRNRSGHVLGAERRAFERIDRDVDPRTGLDADLLSDEQHRRFVALTLTDHHGAFDWDLVEFAPHRIDRGLVCSLLVAVAAQPCRRDRRTFRHADDFQRENAFQQKLRRNGNSRRHRHTPKHRDRPGWAEPISSFQYVSPAADRLSPDLAARRAKRGEPHPRSSRR